MQVDSFGNVIEKERGDVTDTNGRHEGMVIRGVTGSSKESGSPPVSMAITL